MNEISLLSTAFSGTVPRLNLRAAAFARLADAIHAMDTSDWIALGSMLGAGVAAWAAIRSNRRADRAYSLMVAAHRRSDPAVGVELAGSHVHHLVAEQRRVYVFRLLATNQSLAANSIKQIHLSLECAHPHHPPSNVTVPHDRTVATAVGLEPEEVFRVPTPIAPGESISGAAVFSVGNALFEDLLVESYVVAVVDAYNHQARCQPMLLWETES